jgi:hypothetical protein
MAGDDKGSFIRWQGRAIEQLGFVNNVLLVLATGILLFQIQLIVGGASFGFCEKWVVLLSSCLFFLSIIFGCWLAYNRLNSFRLTSQIARKRETNEREDIEDLRKRVKHLDRKTWLLLKIQMILIGLGALLFMAFAAIRLVQPSL